jgi:hypothetical protein
MKSYRNLAFRTKGHPAAAEKRTPSLPAGRDLEMVRIVVTLQVVKLPE